METFTITLNGATRRVTLNGRDYLVTPATMIVEGVLNGSAGALFYPKEEIERDPQAWNGVPILLGHPVAKDGTHVSGRTPEVWNERLLGHCFSAQAADGTLKSEAWFDASAVKQKAPQLAVMLREGKPIEISTGLFTENRPVPEGSTYNGTPYEAIAHSYKPDHLAVLLDEKGACSNADGCGINVNNEEGDATMNRKKLIATLKANCSCWKKDATALEALDDKQLAALRANMGKVARLVLVMNAAKGKKGAAANEGETEGEVAGVDIAALAEFLGVTSDAAADPVAFISELKGKVSEVLDRLGGDGATPAPEPAAAAEEPPVEPDGDEDLAAMAEDDPFGPGEKGEPEKADAGASSSGSGHSSMVGDAARNARRKPISEQQWLATAPPRIRAVVNAAIERDKQERVGLLKRIVANLEGDARKRLWARYANVQDLQELRDLADLVNPVQQEPAPFWLGAGGGPVGNSGQTEEDLEEIEAMIPPVMNFKKEREKRA